MSDIFSSPRTASTSSLKPSHITASPIPPNSPHFSAALLHFTELRRTSLHFFAFCNTSLHRKSPFLLYSPHFFTVFRLTPPCFLHFFSPLLHFASNYLAFTSRCLTLPCRTIVLPHLISSLLISSHLTPPHLFSSRCTLPSRCALSRFTRHYFVVFWPSCAIQSDPARLYPV